MTWALMQAAPAVPPEPCLDDRWQLSQHEIGKAHIYREYCHAAPPPSEEAEEIHLTAPFGDIYGACQMDFWSFGGDGIQYWPCRSEIFMGRVKWRALPLESEPLVRQGLGYVLEDIPCVVCRIA